MVAEPEFDFQVWANTDGDENTSRPGCPYGSETEGRLTMRDAILARTGGRVITSNPQAAHFNTLLQVKPGGVPLNVTRGWTSVNARVTGEPKFRFVNTHLEAFDNQPINHTNQNTDVGNGQVREAQANELIASGGPATSHLPVILVGDLNSDTKTPLKPGDQLADRDLLNAGFVERSTYDPLGCCLNADVLTADGGGSVVGLRPQGRPRDDERSEPGQLVSSTVTGRHPDQRVLGLRPRRALERPGLQVGTSWVNVPPRPRSSGAGRSHALLATPRPPLDGRETSASLRLRFLSRTT